MNGTLVCPAELGDTGRRQTVVPPCTAIAGARPLPMRQVPIGCSPEPGEWPTPPPPVHLRDRVVTSAEELREIEASYPPYCRDGLRAFATLDFASWRVIFAQVKADGRWLPPVGVYEAGPTVHVTIPPGPCRGVPTPSQTVAVAIPASARPIVQDSCPVSPCLAP